MFSKELPDCSIEWWLASDATPKRTLSSAAEERVELMAALRPEGVDVLVEAYEGLTVDFAKKHRAVAAIRGFRTMSDVESECRLAIANRTVADLETVLMVAAPEHAFTSSRLIREVVGLGGDLARLRAFVPEEVLDCLSTETNRTATTDGRLMTPPPCN